MPKGGNWISQGSRLEAAFQTAPVISAVYCLFRYPSKSEFLKPARKEKYNQQSTQSAIVHRDRAAMNLAD